MQGIFAMSRCAFVVALLCVFTRFVSGEDPKSDAPPPVQLTADQDHKLMMEALGIKSLRPGANGSNPNAPNAANYDESKANPTPDYPEPLVMKDGQPVTTAEQWMTQRRDEIVEDFDSEAYGRIPRNVPKVNWEVTGAAEETIGGVVVVTKKIVGHVDNSSYPQ